MHLGTAALLEFHADHRDDDSLVLVTITGTEGSTYRKSGAMMLIARDHQYVGMISGGCLEGDLLHHADQVFSSGKARQLTYHMHAGDELVWSLGIGCDGIIHLQLQKLDRESGFAMLDWLGRSLANRQPVLLAMDLVQADQEDTEAAFGLYGRNGELFGEQRLVDLAARPAQDSWPDWRCQRAAVSDVLLVQIPPQPRVLLCGAGPDAVPVAVQFCELGWNCTVVDHRAVYARADRFDPACEVITVRPEKLHQVVELDQLDAAIVMSHHLENDATYVRQLAGLLGSESAPGTLSYLGVLGPGSRRDKLREMADFPNALIHGPVGLDIGAELPEAIALSIAAEVHAVMNERNGLSLTTKTLPLAGE